MGGRILIAITLGVLSVLIAAGAAGATEPFQNEGSSTIDVKFKEGERPTFKLDLELQLDPELSERPAQIVLMLSAGSVRLPSDCNFVAPTTPFEGLSQQSTATVTFTQEDTTQTCDLTKLGLRSVTATSNEIDGGALTLNLDRTSSLDAGSFGWAVLYAAAASLAIVWLAGAVATARDGAHTWRAFGWLPGEPEEVGWEPGMPRRGVWVGLTLLGGGIGLLGSLLAQPEIPSVPNGRLTMALLGAAAALLLLLAAKVVDLAADHGGRRRLRLRPTPKDGATRRWGLPTGFLKMLCGPLRPRWWFFRVELPSLKWNFKTSWLTNFTAAGAVLASILGATDVLEQIGLESDQKAVFIFINIGALALTTTAPLAFAAFRTYERSEEFPKQIRVPIHVRTHPHPPGMERGLEVYVPTVRVSEKPGGQPHFDLDVPPLNNSGSFDRVHSDARLVAAFRVPVESKAEFPVPRDPNLDPDARPLSKSERRKLDGAEAESLWVAIDLPPEGVHADEALITYIVSIPHWVPKVDNENNFKKWEKAMSTKTAAGPSGTFFGLSLAALIATTGVAVQLAATRRLVEVSNFGSGTAAAATGVLIGLALVAAIFVVRSLSTRPRMIDQLAQEAVSAPPKKTVQEWLGDTGRIDGELPASEFVRISSWVSSQSVDITKVTGWVADWASERLGGASVGAAMTEMVEHVSGDGAEDQVLVTPGRRGWSKSYVEAPPEVAISDYQDNFGSTF